MASISLGDTEHLAKELSKERHGGNVSGYIQELIRDDYQQRKNQSPIVTVIYHFVFYELIAAGFITVGLSFFNDFFRVIVPSLLLIIGFGLTLCGFLIYIRKKRMIEDVIS